MTIETEEAESPERMWSHLLERLASESVGVEVARSRRNEVAELLADLRSKETRTKKERYIPPAGSVATQKR